MLSHLDLLKIQVEMSFVHDQSGRLTYINEPAEPETYPAPRFFLGYSGSGFVYRFRNDLPSSVCEQLEELVLSTSFPPVPQSHPACAKEVEEILLSHAPIQKIWSGPAFRFPEHIKFDAQVVRIASHNADLLENGFSDWISELDFIQPCMAIVEEGHAVSICQSVRKSPHAEAAGVDTLASHRGKGYAPLVVAGWAEAVKAKRKIPFYSTSWENRSSQRVAEKLGLIQFGVDYHVT